MIPTTALRLIPTVPEPTEAHPETLSGYGLRILAFVIAEETTATLTDEQLKIADHVYPIAVAPHHLDARTVDRMADARRLILAAMRWRKADQDALASSHQEEAQESHPPKGASGTSKVPLPTPPHTNPPTPAVIRRQEIVF